MGGRIRQLEAPAVVEADDADAHEVGEVRGVADLLVELELRRVEPVAEAPDQGSHVGRGRVGPVRAAVTSRVAGRPGTSGRSAGRFELTLAVQPVPERERQRDRHQAHERDHDPVHRAEHRTAGAPRRYAVVDPACPGGIPLRLRLIPREQRFFDLFAEDAANVLGGARLLEAMLRTYDQPEARAAEIRATEHRGDEISHDIGHRLEATFVTPFDREDIYALISALDDVLDFVEEAADTFVLYRIEAPTATAVEQAAIIVKQVELLHDALTHLKGFKGLDRYWIEVHRLENEGDRIARAAIAALFVDEKDPVNLVKWKDIYGLLEATIDKAEDVANIIERITIKHA